MKKIFCILSILTIVSPAFADDDVTPPPASDPAQIDYTQYVATASYVRGAVEAITSTYDEDDNPTGKIQIVNPNAQVGVASITTTNDNNPLTRRIVVTKTNELKIPVGSNGAAGGTAPTTIANMWVQ